MIPDLQAQVKELIISHYSRITNVSETVLG